MAKKPVDPTTAAALEVVDMEQKQEVNAATEQATREQMIAQCHQFIGRIQANQLMAKFGDVASLVWLREVKEQKIYRDIPCVGSWDKFCDSVGMSRRKVDEDLQNLQEFGEDFLATCRQLRVGYHDLRKLRQLTNDGSVQIEEQSVIIGEETIPLDSDHHEDLQVAIETALEAKNEKLADATTTLKAKERILESKEDVINKQEREIAKHESRAQSKGLEAGEEAFLNELNADQLVIDGILLKYSVDPDTLRSDLTERMKAGLLESLGYLRHVIIASHEGAKDQFAINDGWDGGALLDEFDESNPDQGSPLSDTEILAISNGIL